MNIISCISYYGTGSSAITDLMREYNNVTCKTDFEINFLYDYHGINYLKYHMINHPIRTVSNEAIADFIKYIHRIAFQGRKMNYQKYFNNNFLEYTNTYLKKILGNSYKKQYLSDLEKKPYIYKLLVKLVNKSYHIFNPHSFKHFTFIKKRSYFLHTIDELFFMNCTKEYLNNLFSSICKSDFLMIDQLLPSSNIDEYLVYFDNIYAIVVDRDPRDVYLSEKYIWRGNVAPVDDIYVFCKWFRWTRTLSKEKNPKCLYIRFEDLVFNYSATVLQIEEYLGLDKENHVFKKNYFNPEISKNNCLLWKKYDCLKELEVIELELKEFLYEK